METSPFHPAFYSRISIDFPWCFTAVRPHIPRTAAVALPPPVPQRSAAQRQWPSGGGPREWPAPAGMIIEILRYTDILLHTRIQSIYLSIYLSYPVLPNPILFYRNLPYPILSHPILYYLYNADIIGMYSWKSNFIPP